MALSPSSRRAWIEIEMLSDLENALLSPSSRRAWIEIGRARPEREPDLVALLAEGVDRNFPKTAAMVTAPESPSSRRAWIEISLYLAHTSYWCVALLAEGVDRNFGR